MSISNNEVLNIMPPQYGLFGLLFAFMNRLQATGDSFYEEITCKQFFLMACMNLFPDEAPTANQLSQVMGCSRQNVKEVLNSLCKKNLVFLQQDEKDKRKQRIYLTEKASLMSEKYALKEQAFMSLLYNGISDDEIRTVYKIISKMEENLKSHAEDEEGSL
ncbi:MAG: winged helix-turn-helix transcriptional regulator [Treponema sp.]|nr:winged helix-turn-helix transcriptional regulator [Candidatus Treponema merdequi]